MEGHEWRGTSSFTFKVCRRCGKEFLIRDTVMGRKRVYCGNSCRAKDVWESDNPPHPRKPPRRRGPAKNPKPKPKKVKKKRIKAKPKPKPKLRRKKVVKRKVKKPVKDVRDNLKFSVFSSMEDVMETAEHNASIFKEFNAKKSAGESVELVMDKKGRYYISAPGNPMK